MRYTASSTNTIEDCLAHVYVLVAYLDDVYIVVFTMHTFSFVLLNECI